MLTLLCAVVAITLASLEFQDHVGGARRPGPAGHGGRRHGVRDRALAIWIPIVIAVAIAES